MEVGTLLKNALTINFNQSSTLQPIFKLLSTTSTNVYQWISSVLIVWSKKKIESRLNGEFETSIHTVEGRQNSLILCLWQAIFIKKFILYAALVNGSHAKLTYQIYPGKMSEVRLIFSFHSFLIAIWVIGFLKANF